MDDPFVEEQRYTQRWLWAILIFVAALQVGTGIVILYKLKALAAVSAIPFAGAGLLLLLFRAMRLDTRITAEDIAYRFFPIQRRFRTIARADIRRLEVITYNPIRDYGGWGIRYGRKGLAYNVRGDKGLLIELDSGKRLLIGTGRPEEMEAFLRAKGYPLRPGD